ncbi:MAG TPA: hypothetical protein VJN18_22630 [Polyangiaceae bacterium]|nr:hypothetical protein [Polyangiaceae bacterium]
MLLDLAHRWRAPAVVQRLGCLLDLHRVEVPADARSELVALTQGASKIQLGPRGKWGYAGKLVQPWNVVENVPRDVLVSSVDQGRRRVVFRRKEARP